MFSLGIAPSRDMRSHPEAITGLRLPLVLTLRQEAGAVRWLQITIHVNGTYEVRTHDMRVRKTQ